MCGQFRARNIAKNSTEMDCRLVLLVSVPLFFFFFWPRNLTNYLCKIELDTVDKLILRSKGTIRRENKNLEQHQFFREINFELYCEVHFPFFCFRL